MYADTREQAETMELPIYEFEAIMHNTALRVNSNLFPIGLTVEPFSKQLIQWAAQMGKGSIEGRHCVVIISQDIITALNLPKRHSVDYKRLAKNIEVGDTLYSGEKVTSIDISDLITINDFSYYPNEVLEIV